MALTVYVVNGEADIFAAPVQALVNPVNILGIMGKGLALEFKDKYPKASAHYTAACKRADFQIGTVCSFVENGQAVIHFPTKTTPHKPSEYRYIQLGMIALVDEMHRLNISRIAIPALGCGLGGLAWVRVKGIILTALGSATWDADTTVYLFPPK